jgi:hypothetical protein
MENPENKPSEDVQEEIPDEPEQADTGSELSLKTEEPESVERESAVEDESYAQDDSGIEIEETEPAPPDESRLRRFVWRTARWVLGLLVVFMLGFLTAIYGLYRPALNERQSVERQLSDSQEETASLQSELDAAQGQIDDLQARIEELSSLETLNQELELHVNILSARSDVISARLALANDDPSRSRAALARTGETLNTLQDLLAADQSDLVTDMQDRLELVLSEIDEDTFAADSDLGVLERSLLELENDYFTQP